MRRVFSHPLMLASLAAVFCAAGLLLGTNIPILRLILAVLLLLLLPGYASYAALFIKPPFGFGFIEAALVIVGMSLLVAILTGFSLYWLGWGLNLNSWTAVLSAFTLATCLVAGLRRKAEAEPAKPPANSPQKPASGMGSRIRNWGERLTLVMALLATAGAVRLAQRPITDTAGLNGYTMLWILPDSSPESSQAEIQTPKAVNLGIENDQFTTTGYDLRLVFQGQVVREWPDIRLAPGDKWESSVEIPGKWPAGTPVEAFLYKLDQPATVYRQVKLITGP